LRAEQAAMVSHTQLAGQLCQDDIQTQ